MQLLPLQNNSQPHQPQHGRLQPRILGQQNRAIAHIRHEPDHAADDVAVAVEVFLAAGVEFGVVGGVVVAFC